VKNEENLLKEDRQSFLKQYKKLKTDKEQLQQDMIPLKAIKDKME
jgi:hypothetical protein